VEQVSWEDCQEFCRKFTASLNGRVTVRLPTEAEWEYACRAGTTSDYWSGNDEAALKTVGWYSATSKSETQPVGQLKANPWGLFDVHGNVWEWCHDGKREYTAQDQVDPEGKSNDNSRVVRGGAWVNGPGYCRAAFRYTYAPLYRDDHLGFRVAFRLD
jgi:formylglycine-generating enzyme required for sulfatase activity